MNKPLGEYFTSTEFEKSQTALRHGIDNEMPDGAFENAKLLVEHVLDPLRKMLGKPIIISSGYRSIRLNKIIGGNPNSQHLTGKAADIECVGLDNFQLTMFIEEHFSFDQLIAECVSKSNPYQGWVHLSWDSEATNRNQVLTYTGGRYLQGLNFDD